LKIKQLNIGIFISGCLLLLSSMILVVCGTESAIDNRGNTEDSTDWGDLKLWYEAPAKEWNEALPVGNGRLGAMVFGTTERERIQFNEETLWSGGPYDASISGGAEVLAEIQKHVFNKNYMMAHKLFGRHLMGWPIEQQKYQPFGDLYLNFPGHEEVSEYTRELDLDQAIARVTYRVGDTKYTREVFSSPVDQVIIVRVSADKPGKINLKAVLAGFRNVPHSNYDAGFFRMDCLPPDILQIWGKNSTYLGIEGKLDYRAKAKVLPEGGEMKAGVQSLTITNANAATFLIAAATSFVNYNNVSADPEARVDKVLKDITGKSYDKLRESHITEHRRLFRRVNLNIGSNENAGLPTNERLTEFADGDDDPQLAELYYQFGRYLMISSSRPGTQAANLQGIWNKDGNPSWDSKYTTNINLEMNYWPAETINLQSPKTF